MSKKVFLTTFFSMNHMGRLAGSSIRSMPTHAVHNSIALTVSTWAADFTWVLLSKLGRKKNTDVLFLFGDAGHRHNYHQSNRYDPWVVGNSRLHSQLALTAELAPIECGAFRFLRAGRLDGAWDPTAAD